MPDDITPPPKCDLFELYKIAINTRQFEIQMFWQRSNYFLALNTAIAIGFFANKEPGYSIILSFVGMIVCVLWFYINLGGKFWQCRWEEATARIERKFLDNPGLFSASKEEISLMVKARLGDYDSTRFKRWIKRQTLMKPSVSMQMTMLSFLFIIFWAVSLIYIQYLQAPPSSRVPKPPTTLDSSATHSGQPSEPPKAAATP